MLYYTTEYSTSRIDKTLAKQAAALQEMAGLNDKWVNVTYAGRCWLLPPSSSPKASS